MPTYTAGEQALIDEYDFQVSKRGKHFIVIDPKLKDRRNRHVGEVLYDLLCDAVDRRTAEQNQDRADKKWAESVAAKQAGQEVKAAKPDTTVLKFEGTFKKGKLYEIKKLVFYNRDAKPDTILTMLRGAGLDSTITVVSAVRSDFLHSLRLLDELGALKKEE